MGKRTNYSFAKRQKELKRKKKKEEKAERKRAEKDGVAGDPEALDGDSGGTESANEGAEPATRESLEPKREPAD